MKNINKVIYVHGIGSNGNGNTVNMLKNKFPDIEVIAPDIPMNPKEAIKMLKDIVKTYADEHTIMIGTSLGGFYTMNISGIFKIVVNPAMYPSKDIPTAIGYGEHPYFGKRVNGETTYTVDEEFVKGLKEVEERLYNDFLDWELIYETFGVFGTEDKVVSHKDDFETIYGAAHTYTDNFGHRITADVFDNVLIPIMNMLDVKEDNLEYNM